MVFSSKDKIFIKNLVLLKGHSSLCLLDISAAFNTKDHNSKDCLPGSVLLTLLSSGFIPISLLALSPLRHRL